MPPKWSRSGDEIMQRVALGLIKQGYTPRRIEAMVNNNEDMDEAQDWLAKRWMLRDSELLDSVKS